MIHIRPLNYRLNLLASFGKWLAYHNRLPKIAPSTRPLRFRAANRWWSPDRCAVHRHYQSNMNSPNYIVDSTICRCCWKMAASDSNTGDTMTVLMQLTMTYDTMMLGPNPNSLRTKTVIRFVIYPGVFQWTFGILVIHTCWVSWARSSWARGAARTIATRRLCQINTYNIHKMWGSRIIYRCEYIPCNSMNIHLIAW